MRFNPFKKLNCQYGAPMGRHGHDAGMWDREGKLYARHCVGDYWGHSDVYAVWTRGGDFCTYVDGVSSLSGAIAKVIRLAA
jgi:hypothetical protein